MASGWYVLELVNDPPEIAPQLNEKIVAVYRSLWGGSKLARENVFTVMCGLVFSVCAVCIYVLMNVTVELAMHALKMLLHPRARKGLTPLTLKASFINLYFLGCTFRLTIFKFL